MKKKFVFLIFIFFNLFCYSQQIKVAIVDFDNTSGISKYDGLGKAMSSMLISDIEANVSPKRLQLVERSQINKILKEQNFQKTSSVDKASTVKMGKLLGVKYLLVGDIFVLNDALVINSRLVDSETGDIKFSKKQEGKLVGWLTLKTNIANEIAMKLKLPLDSKSINSNNISENSLLLYANGINFLDKNEIENANKLLTELQYTEKNFNYTNSQLDKLFEMATNQTSNNELKQKAYILNLHKRISSKPDEAWIKIENFWNGPLDEKYPYLEYIFLKNTFEKFKNDSIWLNYPVSRHGVNTKLGDMILFSISNHANLANEIKTGIYYNEIRKNKFPDSEICIIWGEPIHPSKYRWSQIDDPNPDTLYYNYLVKSQDAIIFGLGPRNYKKMREYLINLISLLDKPFYDFIQSEYYYEIEDKKIPIFNPYDVLGTLIYLVGNDIEKEKSHKFFELYKDKKMYTGAIENQSWYNNTIENDMLIKNACVWADSSLEDFRNKNWTELEFEGDFTAQSCRFTMNAICLSISRKDIESYNIMYEFYKIIENKPNSYNTELWAGIKLISFYYIIQMRNSIALGKIDDVKHISRQLQLLGIDPYTYSGLHTELYD
jgi:TolB-like protein